MAYHGIADHGEYHKDDLESCIIDMICKLDPWSRGQSIYRVPKRLRDLNENAYTPRFVSIGPLHRGNKELQATEALKLIYLEDLLGSNPDKLGSYTSEIRKSEATIRSHYDEAIEPMSSDEFVKMILFDSAYIIRVMLKKAKLIPHFLRRIQGDLALLENQIPFFIVELLFKVAYPDHESSFIELCIEFFKDIFLVEGLEYSNCQLPSDHEVKHFVDLLRLCHLPSSLRLKSHSESPYTRIHCATQLKEAGIKFGNSLDNCLVDIIYDSENKMLKIPQVVVSDCTESVLKNMVALEQFQYVRDSYITDYVIFLDNLVGTARDADILIQSQIIKHNFPDSSAVSRLFNGLSDEIMHLGWNNHYYGISQELDKHCRSSLTRYKSSWNKWRAILKRDYCGTPWVIASTAAAIVLLILTCIQAICSIIEVT